MQSLKAYTVMEISHHIIFATCLGVKDRISSDVPMYLELIVDTVASRR